MDILGRITENRKKRGWSEYQLAERSGIPQSTISSWYKKGMTPTISSLEKICVAFGITLSRFFADNCELGALTPAQIELLDKWDQLTVQQKDSFSCLIDSILNYHS